MPSATWLDDFHAAAVHLYEARDAAPQSKVQAINGALNAMRSITPLPIEKPLTPPLPESEWVTAVRAALVHVQEARKRPGIPGSPHAWDAVDHAIASLIV